MSSLSLQWGVGLRAGVLLLVYGVWMSAEPEIPPETIAAAESASEHGRLQPIKEAAELAREIQADGLAVSDRFFASGARVGRTGHLLAAVVEQALREVTGYDQGKIRSTRDLFRGDRAKTMRAINDTAKNAALLIEKGCELVAKGHHQRKLEDAEAEVAKPVEEVEAEVSADAQRIMGVMDGS